MTEAEKNYYYVTSADDAYLNKYVLTIGEYTGASTQHWNLLSEDDLAVTLELGEDWFVNVAKG